MKLIYLNLLLLLFCLSSNTSFAMDTLHVVTHNRETVVTDPSSGNKTFTRWGVFPLKPDEIRKITLKVTFACPDSMRCADWDYSDRISLRRKGGKKGKDLNYELARMLTPYGGAFSRDWRFQWEVDVTDFALLLRDSVEVEYNHSGYEPNKDRGWAVTLDFEIIKGKPSRIPLAITKIYDSSFPYGNAKDPIDKHLLPVSFNTVRGSDLARLRIVQTGHGMDRPDNCAEFCSKMREVMLDSKLVDRRYVWKECSDNPLFPQAGTWLIDRAAWCPGYLVQPDLLNFRLKPQTRHNIQLKMENYQAVEPSAAEVISAYLIQYGPAQKKYDLAIDDIINPSSKDIHSRLNTELLRPRIAISNQGSETITNVNFHYSFGMVKGIYRWKGALHSSQRDTIDIPVEIPAGSTHLEIYALLGEKNKDEYVSDNTYRTTFSLIPRVNGDLKFVLATNNEPAQTSYSVIDAAGKVYYERKEKTLDPNKVYTDYFNLKPGTYRLLLEDSGHDGLEFWFNNKGGAGYAMLQNTAGELVKVFQPDFGKSLSYIFHVDGSLHPANPDLASFRLFPTRTNDTTTFQYQTNKKGTVRVELVSDPGDKVVESYSYNDSQTGNITYDLSKYTKSRFYFKAYVDGKLEFKKRIRVKE